MTGQDLISSALRLLGVLASGESLSAGEATDGLASLNDLLDSLSTERLLIPNKVREVFPLIASQSSYTMGSGGNFSTTRPIRVEKVLIQITTTSPVLELPLQMVTEDEFADIAIKTLSSTYPQVVYFEGTYPLETLNIWPVPTTVNSLVIYSQKPLTNLTLSSTLSLPPGYARMLRYNLAVELAPEYGKMVPEVVSGVAHHSKADLKRINFTPDYLKVDEAIRAKPAVFDWRTGE